RVTDATGKELPARMEVVGRGESQRDSVIAEHVRVASLRATLGQAKGEKTTLKGLRRSPMPASSDPSDTSDPSEPEEHEGQSPTLAIVVNDADAIYPIRIDPTFSDANWTSLGGLPGTDNWVRAAVVDGSGNL